MTRSFEKGSPFCTWVDLLRYQSSFKPTHPAYTFLNGQEERETLTFSQLDRRARAVATKLQSVAKVGERALLLYPSGLEYIIAFMGCIYAGVVPVPAYPPQSSHLKRHAPRLQSIFADSKPCIVLTISSQLASCELVFSGVAGVDPIHWLVTDTISDGCAKDWIEPALTPESLAFLQYTSGSTALPKGVMITHQNLLHNESLIKGAFEHSDTSLVVGWLPLYHDMGLIGNVLQPLYLGVHCVLMSPVSFLQDPLQWLSTISRYKATTSGGPNFAYELCIKKSRSEDRPNLDLSSWKVAYNGAERVRHDTIERFTRAFEPFGFQREAFYPCYGLAEGTLIVSGGKKSSPPVNRQFSSASLGRDKLATLASSGERASMLIGCGQSLQESGIIIVAPESLVECKPGGIGEIWVSGESVAKGYWQKPEETDAVFRACTKQKKGPYLRTGDLGFIFEGELFVSGRLKDLIIIGGYNHHPEDIELTVEKAHEALRPSCGAAFSVDIDDEERLVVVQEVERRCRGANLEEAISAIRQAVAQSHGLQVHAVVLVRAGSVPKTSSGKIQRHLCRSRFLEKHWKVLKDESVHESPSEFNDESLSRETIMVGDVGDRQTRLELYLLQAAAQVLKVRPERLNSSRSLRSVVIDSLMAVQLASLLEVNLQVTVPMAEILGAATFTELAALILSQLVNDVADSGPVPSLSPADVRGNIISLTWQQESLWLQHQTLGGNSHTLNILLAIRLKGILQVEALEQSLNTLVSRHAILRTTYSLVDEKPVQIIALPVPAGLPVDSLLMIPEAAREAEVCRSAAREVHFLFNLETGPLIKWRLLKVSPQEHVLLIVTHHIACDGWSVQLLLKELSRLYQLFSTNSVPDPILPKPTRQYSDLAQRQSVGPAPKGWEAELNYWRRQLGGNLPEMILPRNHARSKTPELNNTHELFIIPQTSATALKSLNRNEEVTLFMVLLSAFKILLCRYSQQTDVLVGSSVANRNSADVQEIIGPFTNAVALRTFFGGDPDLRQILRRVKQTTLGAYANQELPFDAILQEIGWKSGDPPPFNTIFLFQNFLVPVWDMSGITAQLEEFDAGLGNSELALVIYEKAGVLVGTFKFNTDLYDRGTIRDLIASYLAILEQMGEAPERILSQFKITKELARRAIQPGNQQQTIAVAATFVADLVKPSLEFWMEELKIPCRTEFAPYNQVFQQLLDPESLLRTNRNGINVVLIRFADWNRDVNGKADSSSLPALAGSKMDDLIAALKTAASNSSVPHLVCACPGELDQSAKGDGLLQRLEERFREKSKSIQNLYFVDVPELLALYPVPDVYDPWTDELGRIPFSPAFFTALGTIIARKTHALRAAACKVIVLDCDQTLWKGIAGEDGVEGIEIDPARQALQEFLITQHNSGIILCLASKNEEQDVLEVFQRHPGMRLKLEHIAAKQINWNAKSANLKLLSQQLGLGLESFIFIDDSPWECAEVETGCPEVLVLQLPEDPEDILKFPNHVWAFDKLRITEEDKLRSEFYQQDQQREQLRSEVSNLSDFISSLDLECEISDIKPKQIARVAQLTQRTNQFNTTAIRRSESEILKFCGQAKCNCCVVEARDRFGDYGLVGTMFVEEISGVMRVDSFLLSCRALGRGIEHQMLSHLGKQGQEWGITQIHVSILHTSKNRLVAEFLKSVGGVFTEAPEGQTVFQIPVNEAAAVKYAPLQKELASVTASVQNHSTPTSYRLDSKTATRIATQLCDVEQIDKEINAQSRQFFPEQNGHVAPGTPIEEMLAAIWASLLRLEQVGIHDNFMELGGNSLVGTVLVSRIRKALGVELPLSVILEKPTIAELAGVIEQEVIDNMSTQEIETAAKELDAISDDEAKRRLRDEAPFIEFNENR